ncbi:hypothetical protein [Amycolatopsis echigonensis]|nr:MULTISPECIES: hypothetical protein [Amycolatopsis]
MSTVELLPGRPCGAAAAGPEARLTEFSPASPTVRRIRVVTRHPA